MGVSLARGSCRHEGRLHVMTSCAYAQVRGLVQAFVDAGVLVDDSIVRDVFTGSYERVSA